MSKPCKGRFTLWPKVKLSISTNKTARNQALGLSTLHIKAKLQRPSLFWLICFIKKATNSQRKFGSDGNGNPNYGREASVFSIKQINRWQDLDHYIGDNIQDWSPRMSFILKGSQILAFQLKVDSNPRRQSKNIEMNYITHIKLVNELYDTYFWDNTKNQESTI